MRHDSSNVGVVRTSNAVDTFQVSFMQQVVPTPDAEQGHINSPLWHQDALVLSETSLTHQVTGQTITGQK